MKGHWGPVLPPRHQTRGDERFYLSIKGYIVNHSALNKNKTENRNHMAIVKR